MNGIGSAFGIIIIIIMLLGLFNTSYEAIKLYNCIECSAPWTTALLMPGLIYVFILGIFLILYFVITHSEKK